MLGVVYRAMDWMSRCMKSAWNVEIACSHPPMNSFSHIPRFGSGDSDDLEWVSREKFTGIIPNRVAPILRANLVSGYFIHIFAFITINTTRDRSRLCGRWRRWRNVNISRYSRMNSGYVTNLKDLLEKLEKDIISKRAQAAKLSLDIEDDKKKRTLRKKKRTLRKKKRTSRRGHEVPEDIDKRAQLERLYTTISTRQVDVQNLTDEIDKTVYGTDPSIIIGSLDGGSSKIRKRCGSRTRRRIKRRTRRRSKRRARRSSGKRTRRRK